MNLLFHILLYLFAIIGLLSLIIWLCSYWVCKIEDKMLRDEWAMEDESEYH